MGIAALIAAAIVSVTLAVAAVGKLRDPGGLVEALPGLGLSDRLAPLIGPVLPVVEVSLAVALWVPPSRRIAAVLAACLLGTFTALVAIALLRGRRVRCACFGSLSAAELSWRSLARNAVLVALAVVAAAQPTTWGSAARAVNGVVTLVLGGALLGVVAAFALLVRFQLELFRRYGEVLNRLDQAGAAPPQLDSDGLAEPGTAVAPVTVGELDRGPLELASLWADGRRALLVFTNPGCHACRSVMAPLAAWATSHRDVTVAVVSPHSARRTRDEHPDAPIRWLVDKRGDAVEALGVTRTPVAVLVEGGTVVDTARGSMQVVAFLDEIGLLAAGLDDVELVGPDGQPRRISDVVDGDGALLFWRADCPHCERLVPALGQVTIPRDGQVAVVVAGPPHPDAAAHPDWPVLFDPSRLAARVAEVPGTPSLVRLAEGQPLGPAAVGGDAVLEALAGLAATGEEVRR